MKRTRRAAGGRSPARGLAFLAFIVALALATGLVGSCNEWRRSLGEDCLKDQDCLSGICSQFHCGTVPPYLGAEGTVVGADGAGGSNAPVEAASNDAPIDGSGGRDATAEAGGGDASAEGASVDAPEAAVVPEAGATDGSTDARGDAAAEASADAGADGPADSSSDVAEGG
jgi:hypothetical protein